MKRRSYLSHTRIWEQAKAEEKEAVNKEKRAEAENTKKAVKTIQSKVEKTTLGDLSALADLKKKLDKDESNATATAPKSEAAPAEAKAEATEPKVEEPTPAEPKVEEPTPANEEKAGNEDAASSEAPSEEPKA